MIASYSFKGITEHIFTFPDHNWLTLLNGEHTLRIVATDDKDDSTTRTYTFTKAIDEISVMFEEPMESLEAMYLAVEEMVAELPTGCQIWVYVCNDGFDEHPSWQDATVEVRNGTKSTSPTPAFGTDRKRKRWNPATSGATTSGYGLREVQPRGPVYLTSIDGHWK